MLLAGDAAHRFPPAGAFGMNTGIQVWLPPTEGLLLCTPTLRWAAAGGAACHDHKAWHTASSLWSLPGPPHFPVSIASTNTVPVLLQPAEVRKALYKGGQKQHGQQWLHDCLFCLQCRPDCASAMVC